MPKNMSFGGSSRRAAVDDSGAAATGVSKDLHSVAAAACDRGGRKGRFSLVREPADGNEAMGRFLAHKCKELHKGNSQPPADQVGDDSLDDKIP